jgi:hypothetical protein
MIVQFDSKLHLVVDPADVFAAAHFYSRRLSARAYLADRYLSYRLIARNEIEEYLSKKDDVQIFSVYLNDTINTEAQ